MTDLSRETAAYKYNPMATCDDDVNMPKFKERKTTQVAAWIVHACGGKMDVGELLALLYLIDREALKRWGRPVTFDRPHNFPLGPTPSETSALAHDPLQGEHWPKSFSTLQLGRVINLLTPPTEIDELSQAEIDLVQEVFRDFGHKSFGKLKTHLQSLPEFHAPSEYPTPITWDTLLRAVGWKGEDLEEIKRELEASAKFEKLIG